jgi:predicted ATPase
MKTLTIEGVRAFKRPLTAPLGKLTLLVGQSSTGKSTFLACTRIAWDIAAGRECDFNEYPFELGAYESIAHYHGGRGERVKEFAIGAEFRLPKQRASGFPQVLPGKEPGAGTRTRTRTSTDTRTRTRTRTGESTSIRTTMFAEDSLTIGGTFQSDHGSPNLVRWSATDARASIEATRQNGRVIAGWHDADGASKKMGLAFPRHIPLRFALGMIPPMLDAGPRRDHLWAFLRLFGRSVETGNSRPYAFAPVRSRPLRTYEPIRDRASPEGEHIPALLSRLHSQGGKPWKALSESLLDFGRESGLFSELSIRSLGKKQESEPFQIRVGIAGQRGTRSLLDVGYGVSQVLPIVVESALGPRGRMLLVQQPEVHLHPQAQAALGDFFATSAGQGAARYVVETHSDYIVDRVAMAIRDPNHPLKARDVSLLFFESEESGVRVHAIEFSETGDVVNPPPGYRRFFLDEQARYLGADT